MSDIAKTKQRRNRISLVCSNCKERKIKCNRQKPCSNCIKSSSINSCTYNYDLLKKRSSIEITEWKLPTKESLNVTNVSANNNETSRNRHGTEVLILSNSEPSILDIKFNPTIKYIIYRKPSNTQIRPAFYSFYLRQQHLLSYKFLMSFKQVLNNERKVWKSRNFNKQFQLIDLQYNCHGSDCTNGEYDQLNSLIEKLICNNYYAILERLKYFQSDLNVVLLDAYLPMGVVQLIFHYYFNIRPTGVTFRRPVKTFEYSLIALIASIVELTNIFTKHEQTATFNFPIPQQNNEFNEMAVKLLNVSNYRRKCSIFSVYTLLNLRLSLMIYGDAQSGGINMQNAYPLFQSAVSICVEMGLHTDQDRAVVLDNMDTEKHNYKEIAFAKEIPVKSLKLLWNYLLALDANYYIDASILPFIDDRYCHGFYQIPNNEESRSVNLFTDTIKEISYSLLGNKPTSLAELFEDISKINKLLIELKPLDNFEYIDKHENLWKLFYIKFKLLNLLFIYQFKIGSLLDDVNLAKHYTPEVLDNPQNKEIIESLKNECAIKCKLIYLIGLNTILKISKSNVSYKFLLYNREIFSAWIGIETIAFIDMIISKNINEKKKSGNPIYTDHDGKFTLPDPPVFDTKELETVLLDFSTSKHSRILNKVEEACNPGIIVSFLTEVYESVLNVPALFSDYKFFVMTKLFLLTIYFLYCFINVHYSTDEMLFNNFGKLKNLTQKIICKHLHNGKLSHLLPADFIINSLKNNDQRDDENRIDTAVNLHNNINQPTHDGPNPTLSMNDNWNPDPLCNINPLLFDDIASSVFEDEGMVSIFNDINQFFNQPT